MVLNFDLDSIDEAAEKLLGLFPGARIFAFYGEMGAGKTTFIKAVCRRLGVDRFVTSPSFAIINEYSENRGQRRVFHFDFFRLEKVEEAFDIGYEDYFYGTDMCLIEWPEKIEDLLPEETVRLVIGVRDDGKRELRKKT